MLRCESEYLKKFDERLLKPKIGDEDENPWKVVRPKEKKPREGLPQSSNPLLKQKSLDGVALTKRQRGLLAGEEKREKTNDNEQRSKELRAPIFGAAKDLYGFGVLDVGSPSREEARSTVDLDELPEDLLTRPTAQAKIVSDEDVESKYTIFDGPPDLPTHLYEFLVDKEGYVTGREEAGTESENFYLFADLGEELSDKAVKGTDIKSFITESEGAENFSESKAKENLRKKYSEEAVEAAIKKEARRHTENEVFEKPSAEDKRRWCEQRPILHVVVLMKEETGDEGQRSLKARMVLLAHVLKPFAPQGERQGNLGSTPLWSNVLVILGFSTLFQREASVDDAESAFLGATYSLHRDPTMPKGEGGKPIFPIGRLPPSLSKHVGGLSDGRITKAMGGLTGGPISYEE